MFQISSNQFLSDCSIITNQHTSKPTITSMNARKRQDEMFERLAQQMRSAELEGVDFVEKLWVSTYRCLVEGVSVISVKTKVHPSLEVTQLMLCWSCIVCKEYYRIIEYYRHVTCALSVDFFHLIQHDNIFETFRCKDSNWPP